MPAITPIPSTLLVFTPLSGAEGPLLTPYGVRGITQTLEPIGGDAIADKSIQRDVNGNLMVLIPLVYRKYESVISCKDTMGPALDGVWRGDRLLVECAAELAYLTGGTPQRPVVSGSSRDEGGFTFYRPLLDMVVCDIKYALAEWPADYQWMIKLQEY